MSSTFVFIDAAIEDAALLSSGVRPDATVVVLNLNQDGIEQISTALADQKNLDSVHIFSHGAPGTLQLGASRLSLETIDLYDLQPWQRALQNANLLIYGCQVAAGEQGDRFLRKLHDRTGANIAASATPTGSRAKGGDWQLERSIGAVERSAVLSATVMAQYDSTLQLTSNFLYGVALSGGTSQLYVIDLQNGTSQLTGTLSFSTFALARQSTTGNLYYVQTGDNAPVAFFDVATGQNAPNLPNTTGIINPAPDAPPAQFVKLAQAIDGSLYAMNSSTSDLYRILVTGATAGAAQDLGTVRLPDGQALPIGGGDVAFDPNNPNRLFAIVTRPDDPTVNLYQLYAIDITSLSATLVGDVRLPSGQLLNDVGAGSLAFGQDGFLYATSQSEANGVASTSNRLFRISPTTGLVLGSTAIQGNLQFNDFATLPTAVINPNNPDSPDEPGEGNCVPGINRRGRQNRNNRLFGDNDINRLTGANRNDLLVGYGCSDTLLGRQGRDVLRGGDGRDLLVGNQGNDRLNGGRGNDRLNGGLGNDTLIGGRGRDVMRGGTGTDRLFGDAGSDRIIGNAGNDLLQGGSEDDVLVGRLDNDRLIGNEGNDILRGNLGADRLSGRLGNDLLDGGRGDDAIRGGAGDDTLFGRLGLDELSGGRGSDRLNGQANADRLRAGAGRDRVLGAGGADLLVGGTGADLLNGGRGVDRLFGGAGNDRLIGGLKADRITTGRGRDRVIYRSTAEGGDRIFDFSTRDDRIDLSRIFAGSSYGSNRAFRQYVRLEQSGLDTTVSLDTNGDRSGGFESFITLSGIRANSLSARNFTV